MAVPTSKLQCGLGVLRRWDFPLFTVLLVGNSEYGKVAITHQDYKAIAELKGIEKKPYWVFVIPKANEDYDSVTKDYSITKLGITLGFGFESFSEAEDKVIERIKAIKPDSTVKKWRPMVGKYLQDDGDYK